MHYPVLGQNQKVGGPCEGCEAIHESPVSFDQLTVFAKLPDATWEGKKTLGISSTVYKADGPPPLQTLFYTSITLTKPAIIRQMQGRKVGRNGTVPFVAGCAPTRRGNTNSLRPASYPSHREPAHIHITIKEPNLPEYYIDEFAFDDNPLLTSEKRQKLENRVGSGILRLKDVGNMYKADRPIYSRSSAIQSRMLETRVCDAYEQSMRHRREAQPSAIISRMS